MLITDYSTSNVSACLHDCNDDEYGELMLLMPNDPTNSEAVQCFLFHAKELGMTTNDAIELMKNNV